MVFWITGLSGAGKTTLATALASLLRQRMRNVVVLDGDIIRNVFGASLGHTVDDRVVQVKRLQAFAKMLEDQNIVVVVAVLFSTPELLQWNRANFRRYTEVYIEAPVAFLQQRDDKGLYAAAAAGRMKHVVGLDIPWMAPSTPDLVIDSTRAENPESLALRVLALRPEMQTA